MRVTVPLLAMVVLGACTAEPPEVSGKMLFAQNCAGCHGADARGGDTGPDLTGLALRNGGVFPRAEGNRFQVGGTPGLRTLFRSGRA